MALHALPAGRIGRDQLGPVVEATGDRANQYQGAQ